jgi:S1-C subfamily serine protease
MGRFLNLRIWTALSVAILCVFTLGLQAQQKPEELLKAITKIRALVPESARSAASLGTEREGSGVVIDTAGHILTIGYLILEAETIEITGPGGQVVNGVFVGYDHRSGFGLLRAKKSLGINPMELGDSSRLGVGDPVLVAAHGGPDNVQGVRVVARQEFAGYWEYLLEDALFTVPPYSNFGGAALIGSDGRLLGIGSLYTPVTIPELGSIPSNMFVPIDLLKPILRDLIVKGRRSEAPLPWLGVYAEETYGHVIVIRTAENGPAEKAGVKRGDIVLTVGEDAVKGLADFYRKVCALGTAGIDVPLRILKGVQIQKIVIRSADRNEYLKTNPTR